MPEKRQEITTEGGLDVIANFKKIKQALNKLESQGIELSLFIDPDKKQIDAAKKVGITSIAVGWGYNGEQILKAHKPDYFAHKPTDLTKLLR